MFLGAPVPQSCRGTAEEQGQNQEVALGRGHPDLSEEPGCPAGMVRVLRLNSVPVGKETKRSKRLDTEFSNTRNTLIIR